MEQTTLETIEQARAAYNRLHGAWWMAYMKSSSSQETTDARTALDTLKIEALAKFGKPNPKHPDCNTCLQQSVFTGGPSHDASPRCRSGRHPHCTCDTCF